MGNSPLAIVFDLDGTLLDSAAGILAALRHACTENGLPSPDPRTERALLASPIYESRPPLIGAPERVPEVIADDQPGLAPSFETVRGDDLDGSLSTRALVIDKVLTRLGRPDPSTVLMVGDRSQDVVGARGHGIARVGAGWGCGLPGELAAAHARMICAEPRRLITVLGLEVAGAHAS